MSVAKTAKRGVTFYDPLKADNGYTLFSGLYGKDMWLIDMEGRILNRWRLPYIPGAHGILLPNGNLLFAGQLKSVKELGLPREFSGMGGILVELDWNGNIVWQAEAPYQNHDFHYSENGHILYLAWPPDGAIPEEIAAKVKGGRSGSELKELGGKIWSDSVVEIDRNGRTIWNWVAYEHLDPEIDALDPMANRTVWPYINAVWRCRDENILLSARYTSEILKIEYPSGKIIGRYGKGRISRQHDCRELENGNILLFDNGAHRCGYESRYSRIVEIDPETDEIVWEYKADPPYTFYSPQCSGSERLPNANTIICEAWHGRIFEVTIDGELVWEYSSPFWYTNLALNRHTNMVWRAHRYPRDYPGLIGKDLDPTRFRWENLIFGPDAFKRDFTPCLF